MFHFHRTHITIYYVSHLTALSREAVYIESLASSEMNLYFCLVEIVTFYIYPGFYFSIKNVQHYGTSHDESRFTVIK